MKEISYSELKKTLDGFSGQGKEPQRILIGYKTFAKLMREEKFAASLQKIEGSPLQRSFKKIIIKIVPEKHYLEIT
ncbi:hypothetical protein [Acinetobacter sp. WZC-1]|uniref:hypothetical protein n=1 Tax=Acinetobacter sp. WZC-1 TaxID=3459034 RepID=UPI00403D9263